MELDGKVAIVTGAAAGIGRATALRLGGEGASVVVADIDADGARAAAREITAAGGAAASVRVDVGRPEGAARMVGFAERRFGGLDLLVNNAGVIEGIHTQLVTYPDVEAARWMRMLDINLRGVILATQRAIEAMSRRGGGAIVNVSSGAGIGIGPHDQPVYAASKAGVMRFSAALAPLRERMNVRVNCVCPGWVDTPMSRRFRAELSPRAWKAMAPKAMLSPDDVADAIVALARNDALAGRVMLCYEGQRRRLLPVRRGQP